MSKTEQTKATDSRYANSPIWQEKALDTAHRAALAASFDGEVSDDWMDDLEGEEA